MTAKEPEGLTIQPLGGGALTKNMAFLSELQETDVKKQSY